MLSLHVVHLSVLHRYLIFFKSIQVQKWSCKCVTEDYRTTSSVTQMLEALQWTELQQRRKRVKVIMLCRIVNHLVAISPQPYIIPRGVVLTTRGHDTRFLLPYSRMQSHQQSFFSISNPSMERIANCCPPWMDSKTVSIHILDMPVLIVYHHDGF
jgi:hypothetical protein